MSSLDLKRRLKKLTEMHCTVSACLSSITVVTSVLVPDNCPCTELAQRHSPKRHCINKTVRISLRHPCHLRRGADVCRPKHSSALTESSAPIEPPSLLSDKNEPPDHRTRSSGSAESVRARTDQSIPCPVLRFSVPAVAIFCGSFCQRQCVDPLPCDRALL